jgi:hypothetical protein
VRDEIELDAVNPQGKWRVVLDGDTASFTPASGQPGLSAGRLDPSAINFTDWFGKAYMFVREGQTKVAFLLTAEQRARIDAWLGPPTVAHLKHSLRQVLAFSIPLGILYVLGSLSSSADAGRSVDALGLALGLAMVGMWLQARFRPHRFVFVVNAVWFLTLGGFQLWEILDGRRGYWWVLILPLVAISVHLNANLYRRFRTMA